MTTDRPRHRLPDVELEQYLLGELSARDTARIARLLEEDPASRSRLAALEQSNREILQRYPADVMGRRIRDGLERPTPSPPTAWSIRPWPATALLGGVAALVVLLAGLPSRFLPSATRDAPDRGAERVKGEGSRLTLHRRSGDGSEALADGARVRPGDVIRIAYQSEGRAYGVIASVDGRGEVTRHLPLTGDRAARLVTGGPVLLDFALELDDEPRWERFYFVTADTPFAVAPVLQALRRIDMGRPVDRPERLELPDDLDQFVVSLDKGMP